MAAGARRVAVGRVTGVHGLQGWLKVHSYCEPREALFEYGPLLVGDQDRPDGDGDERLEDFSGRVHGKALHLQPAGATCREDVEHLVGRELLVEREQLPPTAPGEFYHVDLVGLAVENRGGEVLGTVERVLPGAANDVLVVRGRGELLIPFTPGHAVDSVSLDEGVIVVDWQADWA